MYEIVAEDQSFHVRADRDQALGVFSEQPFKREIIEAVDPGETGGHEVVSFTPTTGFVDLCRGRIFPSTGGSRRSPCSARRAPTGGG